MDQNNKNTEEKETTLTQNTIMPTMIDNEEISNSESKIDLSAIIPNYEDEGLHETEALKSKSKELNSDGSVLIGKINDDYSVEMFENISFPEQIDMEKRKKEKQKEKNIKKKKKEKRTISDLKKEQKKLNKNTLIGLVMLLIVVVFGIYYFNKPKEEFRVISFDVELGDKLPPRISSYVESPDGKVTDEISYKLDTSNVIIDEIGTYQYSVFHNGQIKYGTINIVDTTEPKLEVKNLVINEGTNYEAQEFVANCVDLTGCNYSFEEAGTEKKYTTPGTYAIYIVAKDAFDNRTIKQATLTIEAKGMVKYFVKEDVFNFNEGYQLTTKYELHFTDFMSHSIIYSGLKTEIRTFQDKEAYKKYHDEYYGVSGYTFDEENLTITFKEVANQVGKPENGITYSRMDAVTNFLLSEGYVETSS